MLPKPWVTLGASGAQDSQPATDKMKVDAFTRYVGWSDEDDRQLLALLPRTEPHMDAMCRAFYAAAMADPMTRDILHDAAQVRRLMATLKVWLRELLVGPRDEAYAARRRRIGEVHVDVGVPHAAMFAAMQVVRAHLVSVAAEDGRCEAKTLLAIDRATQLDLMLMTARYHEESQERRAVNSQGLLVSQLPAMVALIDAGGVLTSCTPAILRRFGWQGPIGTKLVDLLPQSMVDTLDLAALIDEVFRKDRTLTLPNAEFLIDGEPHTMTLTLGPLRQAHQLALLHLEDHTTAVRTEALLMRQQHLARLGSLSATIAHELRNPLAGISGALQIIRKGMDKEDRYAPIMGKVLDQVHALNRLVSDLLAFARPRQPEMQDSVDLCQLAREQVDLLQGDTDRHRLHLDCSPEVALRCDPVMVRQILNNLLLNSIQAMPEGGDVYVIVRPEGLRVEDDGPGLTAEAKAHLFEPFHTTKVHGTGLGLANSHRMAELMDGSLRAVEPLRGVGAAFLLRLDDDASFSQPTSRRVDLSE